MWVNKSVLYTSDHQWRDKETEREDVLEQPKYAITWNSAADHQAINQA